VGDLLTSPFYHNSVRSPRKCCSTVDAIFRVQEDLDRTCCGGEGCLFESVCSVLTTRSSLVDCLFLLSGTVVEGPSASSSLLLPLQLSLRVHWDNHFLTSLFFNYRQHNFDQAPPFHQNTQYPLTTGRAFFSCVRDLSFQFFCRCFCR